MNSLKHNKECLDAQKAQREFDEKFPDFCKKCQAWGQVTWRENQAPLGSGEQWMETMSEPCDECERKCPRCGSDSNMLTDKNDCPVKCTKCEWTPQNGGRPEVECWCGMSDEVDADTVRLSDEDIAEILTEQQTERDGQ